MPETQNTSADGVRHDDMCRLPFEVPSSWLTTDPEPEPEAEPYGIDTVGALAEAATWARRWSLERQRADTATAELSRIEALHAPYIDEHGRERCRGCIAGYDPATGQLTNCAYPCPTVQARHGKLTL